MQSADATTFAPCNEVVLQGRVAARPESRELPSGDTIVTARIIIDRPGNWTAGARSAAKANQRSPKRVDTIDCAAWGKRVQRTMMTWQPGQMVRLEGAMRRRFFRGVAGSSVSRVEIEVLKTARPE